MDFYLRLVKGIKYVQCGFLRFFLEFESSLCFLQRQYKAFYANNGKWLLIENFWFACHVYGGEILFLNKITPNRIKKRATSSPTLHVRGQKWEEGGGEVSQYFSFHFHCLWV